MFWFMLIALVAVVAAVAMAVLGDGGALKEAVPDRLEDRLPPDRPLARADIDAVRLPVAVRGYRMVDVDEVLDRLGAELAERDARIAELEASLAGARSDRVTQGQGYAKDYPQEYAAGPAEHVRGPEYAAGPGQEYAAEYGQDHVRGVPGGPGAPGVHGDRQPDGRDGRGDQGEPGAHGGPRE